MATIKNHMTSLICNKGTNKTDKNSLTQTAVWWLLEGKDGGRRYKRVEGSNIW